MDTPRGTKRKRAVGQEQPILDAVAFSDVKPRIEKRASIGGSSSGRSRTGSSSASGRAALDRGLYLSFVDSAINDLREGKSERYDELVAVFSPFTSSATKRIGVTPDATQVRPMLEALSRSISLLDSASHRRLIDTLLDVTWTEFDDAGARAYVSFVCALVAGKPQFLARTIDLLIRAFDITRTSASFASSSITRRQAYDRIHALLRTLVDRVPTLPPVIFASIERHMPAPTRHGRDVQVVYLRNVFRVVDYCPALLSDVLGAVFHQIVQIDVDVQADLANIADENHQLDPAIFYDFDPDALWKAKLGTAPDGQADEDDELDNLDLDDISDDENEDLSVLDSMTLSVEDLNRIRLSVAKLDAVLVVLLDFLHMRYLTAGKSRPSLDSGSNTPTRSMPARPPTPEETAQQIEAHRSALFDTVLDIFDRTVLPTLRTRHVQFAVFWMTSLQPQYAETFITTLISRTLYEADQPIVSRVAAACYLGSFISRATFVDGDISRRVALLLLEYLTRIFDAPAHVQALHNQHDIAIFYAAFQAVILIFCYRWQELRVDTDEDADAESDAGDQAPKWLPELDVVCRAVQSSWNPYKVRRVAHLSSRPQFCAPALVKIFTEHAQKVGFLYSHHVLQATHRDTARPTLAHAQSSFAPTPTQAAVLSVLREAHLQTQFPFDPCELPQCGRYVADLYRKWDKEEDISASSDAQPESDASSSFPTESLHPRAIRMPTRQNSDGGELGKSFNAMSLSPEHRSPPRGIEALVY